MSAGVLIGSYYASLNEDAAVERATKKLRAENERLRAELEAEKAITKRCGEVLIGVEIALVRDEDIDGAVKILLADQPWRKKEMISAEFYNPTPEQSKMLQDFNRVMKKLSLDDRKAIYAVMEDALKAKVMATEDGVYLGVAVEVPNGTTGIIPNASLALGCAQTKPPKPLGFDVRVDGKPVAVLSLDEFEWAAAILNAARRKQSA